MVTLKCGTGSGRHLIVLNLTTVRELANLSVSSGERPYAEVCEAQRDDQILR